MTERFQRSTEIEGQYNPIGGDDAQSIEGELPLEVLDRIRSQVMKGKVVIVEATSRVDYRGKKVINVREIYFEIGNSFFPT